MNTRWIAMAALSCVIGVPRAFALSDTPAAPIQGGAADDGRLAAATFQGLATDAAPDGLGGFNTRVSIELPPFHGLEPKLQLIYNSASPNGAVGEGWSLAAAMMVQRVSPGRGLPLWDDTKDFYLLNGDEFRPCSSLPQNVFSPGCSNAAGPAQYVYYFSKIERYQRLAFDPNNNVWIYWTKDGTRYDFQQRWNTRSNRTQAWLLTSVTDVSQNAVQYVYAADNTVNAPPSADAYWLASIVYNGTMITFWPEARADSISSGFGDSTLAVQRYRLKTIDVQTMVAGGNQRVRTYQLQYQSSPTTGASLLSQVKQFGSDAQLDGSGNLGNPNTASALPPLTLGWISQQSGGGPGGTLPPYGASVHSAALPVAAPTPTDGAAGVFTQDFDGSNFQHVTLDLNGDGLADHLIVYRGGILPGTDAFNVKRAMTTRVLGFIARPDGGYDNLPLFDTLIEDFWGKDQILVGDLDGNHSDELIIAHHQYSGLTTNNGELWPVAPATITIRSFFFDRAAQTFWSGEASTVNWAVAQLQPINGGTPVPTLDADHVMVADVNGDGLADVVRARVNYQVTQNHLGFDYGNCAFESDPTTYTIETALGRGDGSFTAIAELNTGWLPPVVESYVSPDPEGDSLCLLNNTPYDLSHWMVGDVNGDGRSDLILALPHWAGMQNDPENAATHWVLCTAVSTTNDPGLFNNVPYQLNCAHDNMGFYYGDWFFAGDANGDGRADVLRVTKDSASGNSTAYAYTSSIDFGAVSWPTATAYPTSVPWIWDWGWAVQADNSIDWVNGHAGWSAGDVNGDGRTDLVSFHYAPDNDPNLTTIFTITPSPVLGSSQVTLAGSARQINTGPWGTFEQGPAYFPGFEVGDHDGDARADVVLWTLNGPVSDGQNSPDCAAQPNAGGCWAASFSPFVIHSAPTVDDARSWREADVNGDGRPDLVRISNRSPGVVVETRLRNADGSFSTAPADDTFYWGDKLPSARAASFILADFDGDGRTDIVYPKYRPDLNPHQVELLTLSSQGTGLFHQIDNPFVVDQPMDDIAGWFAADVNGDGRADLVHLSYVYGSFAGGCASEHQLNIDTFLGVAGGGFLHATAQVWTCNVPEQLRAWRLVDLNRDGKADLAAVWRDPSGAGLIAYSLISDGFGGYTTRSFNVPAADRYRGRWLPMDLNGDGLGDLVSVDTMQDGNNFDVEVTGLIALGDGNWQATTKTVWPLYSAPDAAAWRTADVNGDGLADLVHPSFFGGTVLVDGLVAAPQWGQRDFVLSPMSLPGSFSNSLTPDLQSWHAIDVNGDGWSELQHVTFNPAPFNELEVELLTPAAAPDLLTTIDNGIGGVKSVGYSTSLVQTQVNDPVAGCRLPPGRPPLPVASIAQSSWGTTFESLAFSYTCPVWSTAERRMWGWQQGLLSEGPQLLDRPPAVEHRSYAIGDACGPQLTHSDRTNVVTQESTYENTQYVPSGLAMPFHCEVLNRTSGETDINLNTAESEIEYVYDVNGDLEWLNEDGDKAQAGDERTTHYSHALNSSLYIDTLYQERVYTGFGGGGTKVRDLEYCYDMQNPPNCGHTASSRGLRTATIEWNDQLNSYYTTKSEYDSYGNLTKTTDANNNSTIVSYDTSYHIYPVGAVNALTQTTSATWNYVLSRPLTSVDRNHNTVQTNVYDPLGRITSVTTADNGVTRYEYNQFGTAGQNLTTRYMDGSQDGVWVKTVFDGLGRETQSVRKGDSIVATSLSTENSYGDASRRPQTTTHLHSAQQGATATETFSYDYQGRLTLQHHPDNNTTSATFFTRETHIEDERLDKRNVYLDAYGRTSSIEELFTDQNGVATSKLTLYGYDTLGRLQSVQDAAGNLFSTTIDSMGRKVSLTDPDMGFWRYTYDGVGNLLTQTDARNITATYTYDVLNRRKTEINTLNTRLITWTYDENGHTNPIGRLTSVHDSNDAACVSGTASLNYDTMGRGTTETRCVDGITYSTVSHFDNLGRLQTLQYPDAETLTYGYDPAGRLASVSSYVNSIKYDTGSRLSSVTLHNNVVESFTYHPTRDWLTHVGITANGGSYAGTYTYWPDSLVKTSQQVVNGISAIINGVNVNATSDNLSYAYDELHRLKTVTGGAPESFSYDAIGNMLSSSTLGSRAYGTGFHACGNGVCGAGPHALVSGSGRSFQYDLDGNMTSTTITTTTGSWQRLMTWDEENRPTAISLINVSSGMPLTTNLTYGADGSRVKKVGPDGTTTRWFGRLVERTSAGHLIKYIYAGPRLVATHDGASTPTYYHQDRLGSTRFLTSSTGVPVSNTNYLYSSFGSLTRGSATPADSVMYTGQRQDSETAGFDGDGGLIYLNARYYDPYIARFISADSVIPDFGNPQSLNRYSYVFNNPISNIDPSGHVAGDPPDGGSDDASATVTDNAPPPTSDPSSTNQTAPPADKPYQTIVRAPKPDAPRERGRDRARDRSDDWNPTNRFEAGLRGGIIGATLFTNGDDHALRLGVGPQTGGFTLQSTSQQVPKEFDGGFRLFASISVLSLGANFEAQYYFGSGFDVKYTNGISGFRYHLLDGTSGPDPKRPLREMQPIDENPLLNIGAKGLNAVANDKKPLSPGFSLGFVGELVIPLKLGGLYTFFYCGWTDCL